MDAKKSATFTFELSVVSEDIDTLNHVNNVVYLKWINLAATKHWAQLSKDRFTKIYSWVALRHEIDYLKPAFLGDLISIKTWVGESSGVKSIRHVEIYANNTLLTKAKTTWVLLDAKTMRPRRIQDDILSVLNTSF
ncbi:MAG: acyl-CoA thioesterase [Flavobacteriaceae bacterium]|nr:acyl-CoA thioesterase [Flavobacteriaceae bacterium]